MRALLRVTSPTGDIFVTDGPAVSVSDRETGETYHFVPGLVVDPDDMREMMSWLSDSSAEREIDVTVLRGAPVGLEGIAELSRLDDDTDDYADRWKVIVGELRDVSTDSHAWSARIDDTSEVGHGQLLAPTALVEAATFPRTDAQRIKDGDPAFVGLSPGVDARIAGAYYPVPIGHPGTRGALLVAGSVYDKTAIGGPGLIVESATTLTASDQTLLVADGPVQATHIRRLSVDATNGLPLAERIAVRQVHDKRGRIVSVATPTAQIVLDAEQWVAWDPDDGGGIQDPYGSDEVLRRVNHVIQWALDRSGLRYDWRQIPALEAFSGLMVDTVLSGQARAADWLRSQLLSILPVSTARGPDGLYYWPWLIADSRDAEVTVEVGQDAVRLGPWRTSTGSGVNRVTIAYGFDARSGLPTRRWTLAGHRTAAEAATGEIGLDPWAIRSHAVYGDRPEVMEAPIICDEATAQVLARARLWSHCRTRIDGDLKMKRDRRLMPGTKLHVIESGRFDEVAEILDVRYDGDDDAIVTVRAWPDLNL